MTSTLSDHWAQGEVRTLIVDGHARPRAFRPLAESVRLAREEATFTCLPPRGYLRATGRHRLRFVHNMTTCEIKGLVAGQGNMGMIVNGSGKLVAIAFIDAEEETLLLEIAADRTEVARAQLERYIIADRVAFEVEAERTVFALVGPGVERTLTALGVALPDDEYAWRDARVADVAVRVRKNSMRLAQPGADLTVAESDELELWKVLENAGIAPFGTDAWEAMRVESGWPRDGVDMGEENVPLEASRLGPGLDWDKGCYIGQEVIAMMHYRGRPNKHLRGVRSDGDASLVGQQLVSDSGKRVGKVSSSAQSPTLKATLGLAVIKRKHAEPGTRLQLEGGGTVEVVAVPLEGGGEA